MNIKKISYYITVILIILTIMPSLCRMDAIAYGRAGFEVSAKAAVLIEATTGRVIYAKNQNDKLPMASTTKIMTALLALEHGNIDESFAINDNAIHVEGTSMGLSEGDTATLRIISYGMLLASGNDAANAAAVQISGSIEDFIEMMNARAKMIGMNNTSFETPSGLDSENHYSTAYDMALLGREAIKNPNFREICSAKTAKVEYGNPPYNRWLKNHNKLLSTYEGTFGIKTGFTKKSGRCLVSAVERNNITLIAVTLNAPNDWDDHIKMYNYGFENVVPAEINVEYADINAVIAGGDKKSIPAEPLGNLIIPSFFGETPNIKQKIILQPFYYAPVKTGDVLGEIQFWENKKLIGSVALLAAENAEMHIAEVKTGILEKIKIFFNGIYYKFTGLLQNLIKS